MEESYFVENMINDYTLDANVAIEKLASIPSIFKYIIFAIIFLCILKIIIGFSDLGRSQKNNILGFCVLVLIVICGIYVLSIIGSTEF